MVTILPDHETARHLINLTARVHAARRLTAAGWQVRLTPVGLLMKRGPAFKPYDATCS